MDTVVEKLKKAHWLHTRLNKEPSIGPNNASVIIFYDRIINTNV